MATRYAGDYFGISLGETDTTSSELLRYFPGLKTVSKGQPPEPEKEQEGAVTTGGYKVPTAFAGFKTFEKPNR